jgi:hypothetical protein
MAARCLAAVLGLDGVLASAMQEWSQSMMDGIGSYADDSVVWQRSEAAARAVDEACRRSDRTTVRASRRFGDLGNAACTRSPDAATDSRQHHNVHRRRPERTAGRHFGRHVRAADQPGTTRAGRGRPRAVPHDLEHGLPGRTASTRYTQAASASGSKVTRTRPACRDGRGTVNLVGAATSPWSGCGHEDPAVLILRAQEHDHVSPVMQVVCYFHHEQGVLSGRLTSSSYVTRGAQRRSPRRSSLRGFLSSA